MSNESLLYHRLSLLQPAIPIQFGPSYTQFLHTQARIQNAILFPLNSTEMVRFFFRLVCLFEFIEVGRVGLMGLPLQLGGIMRWTRVRSSYRRKFPILQYYLGCSYQSFNRLKSLYPVFAGNWTL